MRASLLFVAALAIGVAFGVNAQLSDLEADCTARGGQFQSGTITSGPQYKKGYMKHGVMLSHTHIQFQPDVASGDGSDWDCAIDNVFADGYTSGSNLVPSGLNVLKVDSRVALCGLVYSSNDGIHWVHTNCGDSHGGTNPDGFVKALDGQDNAGPSLTAQQTYCYLWPSSSSSSAAANANLVNIVMAAEPSVEMAPGSYDHSSSRAAAARAAPALQAARDACEAAQGYFIEGLITSTPYYKKGSSRYNKATGKKVQLSHTHFTFAPDAPSTSKDWDVAIDNVFVAGYDKAGNHVPGPFANLPVYTRVQLCGQIYSGGGGIHWVHTNCGQEPTLAKPDGWVKIYSPSGTLSESLTNEQEYCSLW